MENYTFQLGLETQVNCVSTSSVYYRWIKFNTDWKKN